MDTDTYLFFIGHSRMIRNSEITPTEEKNVQNDSLVSFEIKQHATFEMLHLVGIGQTCFLSEIDDNSFIKGIISTLKAMISTPDILTNIGAPINMFYNCIHYVYAKNEENNKRQSKKAKQTYLPPPGLEFYSKIVSNTNKDKDRFVLDKYLGFPIYEDNPIDSTRIIKIKPSDPLNEDLLKRLIPDPIKDIPIYLSVIVKIDHKKKPSVLYYIPLSHIIEYYTTYVNSKRVIFIDAGCSSIPSGSTINIQDYSNMYGTRYQPGGRRFRRKKIKHRRTIKRVKSKKRLENYG